MEATNMRKIFAIMVLIGAVIAFCMPNVSANVETIEVTLTPSGTVDIEIDQSVWAPDCGIGSSNQTAVDWANLDNNGTVSVSVTIEGENSEDWTIHDSTAGNDQFKAEFYKVEGGPAWEGFDADQETFDSDIAYDESVDFGLGVEMPTSTTTNNVQHFTVTFTATAL
jgi:hypothetical protein